ncbi:hypothetical protein [Streptomyces platensis]|uniref:hypothetical protein n=1 Tax=Streptomyces platensis TaxID=58346 RepID=UPI0038680FF3|nr:hypothetical protein OG962_17340 [Streptomyces platensis]
MKAVFPYPVLSGDVVLSVDRVFVDNTPRRWDKISDQEHVIALHEVKSDWNEIRIKVSVVADEEELTNGPWSSASCVAVVRNRRTKIRHNFSLRPVGPGQWTGEVELRRGEHVGRCEMDAWIVAEVGGEHGRLVGRARDVWHADFEADVPSRQRSIKMVWKDFADETNGELNEFQEDPWLLDGQADEPVLYLNSAIEGLRAVLERAVSPEQKVVREIMASQISAEAWVAMFNAALYASAMEGDRAQWPGGWHEDVLKRMLPDLFPDRTPDEALTELVERRVEGESGGDLQRRLMHAATLQSRKPKAVTNALRTVGRMATEETV